VHSGSLRMIFRGRPALLVSGERALQGVGTGLRRAGQLHLLPARVAAATSLSQPPDYWHKPTALPQAYWTRHFDIVGVADREAARKALPKSLSTTAYIGDAFPELASWPVAAVNPADLVHRLDFVRAAKNTL